MAALVERVQAGAEHRHDRHEREPDHERGRGRRGARRVADGVGLGQLAGDATGAARRPADEAGERLDQMRRQQREAEEQRDHADRDEQPRRAAEAAETCRPRSRRSTPARRRVPCCASARRTATAGSVEPSRTAAIGGTRVARRAGTIVASRVIPVPTTSETSTVLNAKTVPPSGRSTPIALNSTIMPFAIPKPRSSPIVDASSPITRPSSRTERMTCLREAPSVRSVANSRVRWATVIESVLKITNAPTNRAMAPKPSRK